MLDFTAIQNKLLNSLPATPAGEKGTGIPDGQDFQSLFINAQLKMLSAWAGNEEEDSTDLLPDRMQVLNLLSRFRPDAVNFAAKGKSSVPSAALKQYEVEAAQSVQGSSPSGSPAAFQADSKSSDIQGLIRQSADRHGIPQKFFSRLIAMESGFDPRAVSPKGAMGLGQLMPATARELGLTVSDAPGEGSVWDPASNLDASARYLRGLHDLYREKGIDPEESWNFAAAAYNAGMGNIGRAMAGLGEEDRIRWDRVAATLHRVTGSASRETIRYVDRLRA